jgi:ABC-type branched-subunit amino acid transport system ATPase component
MSRPAAEGAEDRLLDVRAVDVSFGPLQVLFGIDLFVKRGERVALLGTNGAGKSTLLNAISGLIEMQAGSVWFDGQDVTGLSTEERFRLGLVQMPGGRSTFPSLTVLENLRMGLYPVLGKRKLVESRVAEMLDVFPHLAPRLHQAAGTLSGGEQQMMALGRAFITRPVLLMIDELSLGLAPIVMQQVLSMTEQIIALGTTVLIVEQSLNLAFSLATRACFLEKGEVRFMGAPAELVADDSVARSIFFGAAPESTRAHAKTNGHGRRRPQRTR